MGRISDRLCIVGGDHMAKKKPQASHPVRELRRAVNAWSAHRRFAKIDPDTYAAADSEMILEWLETGCVNGRPTDCDGAIVHEGAMKFMRSCGFGAECFKKIDNGQIRWKAYDVSFEALQKYR